MFYLSRMASSLASTRMLVLVVLSLQNSLFTVLRRYSQGVLKEDYSTYEVLLVGELIKVIFSGYMIRLGLREQQSQQLVRRQQQQQEKLDTLEGDENNAASSTDPPCLTGKPIDVVFKERVVYVMTNSGKMFGLALIYGIMNILSFISLRNIGAGMFTIFAQMKILTTATFSTILLQRRYSYTKWRALAALIGGVLLFSESLWSDKDNFFSKSEGASTFIGTMAVLIEVTLSGFASIYFEKVIKLDPLQMNIWERNFQLALVRFQPNYFVNHFLYSIHFKFNC
jgi:solute carrier family 35 (UDP-sugar transporter), member A1/2/3